MTSPRFIVGLLAKRHDARMRTRWNRMFAEEGGHGFFDCYRTADTPPEDLALRLSEMFLHGRRGYVVGEEFQRSIVPLLDVLSREAREAGAVDTVVNDDGVLRGEWFGDVDEEEKLHSRRRVWRKDDDVSP